MAYIGNIPVPQATQTRDRFTATSGQTTFATSGYTPGFLDVYLNGVHLDASDYTATNGSDVVLDTGAATDDIVEVVAFTAFNVSEKLPDQTGNAGEYLTTDGSALSWETITDPTPAAVSGQANTATDFFALPSGTTAQRPGSPSEGYTRYNTDDDTIEVYQDGAWVTYATAYNIEYLVVAGGGGSGGSGYLNTWSGGGGAGGLLAGSAAVAGNTEFTVTVGAGGSAGSAGLANEAGSGQNSVFGSFTAIGGGRGDSYGSTADGGDGGSGGGGSNNGDGEPGGSGTSGQGNDGGDGNGYSPGQAGGGGGGAGAAGGDVVTNEVGGNGGIGLDYSTWATATSTGDSGYYAGGGGGGGDVTGGSAGTGGGRVGASGQGNGLSGLANTGGGAGASGSTGGNPSDASGGAGGSGIVIIRYTGAQRGTGGTVTSSGGYTYHTFTSSGAFTA